MNIYFKKTLITSRVYLVENIDYENLRDYIVEYGILPPAITEKIDSLSTRRQKVREMLDCLPRRPDMFFPTFLVSLYRSNQAHIATHLFDTINGLITQNDSTLKGWLETNIKTMMISAAVQPGNNHGIISNPVQKQYTAGDPVESSYDKSPSPCRERQGPMEATESSFTEENEYGASSMSMSNNHGKFPSSYMETESKIDHRSSLRSQEETSISSLSVSSLSLENDSTYDMDSNPRGLCCFISPKGSQLTSDSFPVVQNQRQGEETSFCSDRDKGNNSLNPDTAIRTLLWNFGFYSCWLELEDSTLHADKLNNIAREFSRRPGHAKLNCCAMALLGFQSDDLYLNKIFSWFNRQNCPSLIGKPKLFLIEIPNVGITPSNLMSDVEIPEDTLVAVGVEGTSSQPGLVSSVIQVCQQMDKCFYSVQDIFSKVQQLQVNYLELKIAVKNSLTKPWTVDSPCKFTTPVELSL